MSSSIKPMFRNDLYGVDAYTRHKRLIQNYVLHYGKKPELPNRSVRTEYDIIRDHHKFIRSDDEDDEQGSWEQRVAKKYYDTLFKEYALCELKYYKEGKIALRWRTEREVVHGKGQFVCASTRCDNTDGLKSWEVNFGYIESGEKKNELVKVRLCPDCSYRLNYKTQKRQAKNKETEQKRRRRATTSDDDDDVERQSRRRRRKHHHDNEDPNDKHSTSDEENSDDWEEQDEQRKEEKGASSIWSKPMETKKEKTKEEEFEDYFADLLQ